MLTADGMVYLGATFALPGVVWQQFVGEVGTLYFSSVKFPQDVATNNY